MSMAATWWAPAYHLRNFFDVKDNDVFWATSDIGWVVGHSYIVYAPLVEGVTSVFREGAPDFPDPGVIWEDGGEATASTSCSPRRPRCACS
jgi:acyl-coenzyme A synthetase/AMP-(fatty) acid ligase